MKQIILMPFCMEAVLMFHKLRKENIEIMGFFDNNVRISHESYCGVPIMLPFYACDCEVIVCSHKHYKAIEQQLLEFSYTENQIHDWRKFDTKYGNLDICDEVDLRNYQRLSPFEAISDSDYIGENGTIKIKELRALHKIAPDISDNIDGYHTIPFCDLENAGVEIPDLPRFRDRTASPLFVVDNCDLKITDVCTLRCKFCSVLLDYPVERKEMPLDKVISTFQAFLDKVDFVRRMTLLGGEPFTYSGLEGLLRYIVEHKEIESKVGKISLYTNATVIPTDEITVLLREANIFVAVSGYTSVKTKIMELVKKLNRFGVHYCIGKMDASWFDMNSIVENERAEEKSASCNATNCPEIENGKFYKCAFLLQANKLQAIPFDARNFLEIDKMTKDSLRAYRDGFTPGCGYCKGRNLEQWKNERVDAAMQIHEPRAYKKYFEAEEKE